MFFMRPLGVKKTKSSEYAVARRNEVNDDQWIVIRR